MTRQGQDHVGDAGHGVGWRLPMRGLPMRGLPTRRRAAALVLGLLAATLLASACSGNDSESGGGGGQSDARAGGKVREGEPGGVVGAPDTGTDEAGGGSVTGGGTGGGVTGGTGQGGTGQARTILQDRAVVYTAAVQVRVADVTAAARAADRIATGAGGLVTDEQIDASSGVAREATAQVTMRVPPSRLRAVLDQIGRLGTRLTGSQTATDVTTQVVDVDSRVTSQRRSVERVRALLSRARTVGEIVSIEAELAKREAELEALLARQKSLGDAVEMATVTASFVAPSAPGPDDERGFLVGLRNGWHAFTATLAVGLTVLGALVPFLGAALLVGVPAWLLLRGRLARRHVPAAPTPTPTPAPPTA